MKKIILLLFLIFISTGCYDYKELNNLAIISGIAIDYDNDSNEYITSFEILNDSDKSISSNSYYASGHGITLIDSFNDAKSEINKIPFYSHVNVMILSQNVLSKHTNDLIDFIIHNPEITNMFYIVIAKDTKAMDIITSTTQGNDTVSQSIYKLIDNKDLSDNLSLKVRFEDFASLVLNDMQDLYLPSVKIDKDKIALEGIAIFNSDKLIKFLNYNESQALNILLDESKNAYYSFTCKKDSEVIINIYNQNISYKIDNNKVNIKATLLGNILKNDCDYNLNDDEKLLVKKYNKIIKDDIFKLIKILKDNNSDVLGINYMYYKNNNDTLDFKKLKFDVDVDVNINNNGLIIEVGK